MTAHSVGVALGIGIYGLVMMALGAIAARHDLLKRLGITWADVEAHQGLRKQFGERE